MSGLTEDERRALREAFIWLHTADTTGRLAEAEETTFAAVETIAAQREAAAVKAALLSAAERLDELWDGGSGTDRGIPYERSEEALIAWLRDRARANEPTSGVPSEPVEMSPGGFMEMPKDEEPTCPTCGVDLFSHGIAGNCSPPPGCPCRCHRPGGMAVSHVAPCCTGAPSEERA